MDDPGVQDCIDRYQNAHFSDEDGYQPSNHNLMREDVILQMYEYAQIFQKAFSRADWNSRNIPSKKVLEVGSAWGIRLNQLLGFNFHPAQLFGIDLQKEYIAQAKSLNPLINYEVMSATNILYPDRFFDCSLACVVLQAMIDDEIISKTLSEMCRVTKDFVLVVDIFDSKYSAQRNGSVFIQGVDDRLILDLKTNPRVEQVHLISSFWTTNGFLWKIYRLFNRIGLSSISYALIIRLLAKHSHKAYFIQLKQDQKGSVV
jgi:ubiquinone/menaquinone biosynthesis C-methylase UbiE